jgi:glucosyl-dolichyl phosphate glucuronosyltransferase
MRFSVVICTHNRAALLKATLSAVNAMVCQGGFEIIVVDNRSTDNTREIVMTAAASASNPLKYLREDRGSKSFALNTAIAASSGEIVAFTDDDAVPQPDWLQRLDAAFARFDCEWAFGRVVPMWETTAPEWFGPRLNGLFALLDLGPDAFVVTSKDQAFFGVNCAASREALARLGPYRTDLGPTNAFGGGGEDTDMFERALADGQRIVYTPDAVVQHYIPVSRLSRGFHRRRMLRGRFENHRMIASDHSRVPRILGIPRSRYGIALNDMLAMARAASRADATTAFEHELRLIRFFGILQQALAQRLWASSAPRSAHSSQGRVC